MHDLVLRSGTVVDGTGADRFVADVAVANGRIVAVGGDVGPGRREIDACDRLVTPGWVDMHTHYDAQATWDPELTPSGWHGVTTVVVGNCGVGFAPVAPDRHDWLIGLMEGVEDIPGAAMHEGISWGWESFPEYLDTLSQHSWVMDLATQIPHGAVRAYVMGERGAANEDATPDDIRAMAGLVEEALRAGALGFSTSRTPLHKSIDGVLVPGTTASVDEIVGIAQAMANAGHGVFQCAVHHPDVPASFDWFRQVATITGAPVTFNFVQTDQAPNLWREVLGHLEQAAADGLSIWGQCTGRPIGVLQSWDSTMHPFRLEPAYREIAHLALPDRMVELQRPERRAAILRQVSDGVGMAEASRFVHFLSRSWNKMWPMHSDADYEPEPHESVAAVAGRLETDAAALAYDHLMTEGGHGVLYFPLFNYSENNLDPLMEMHRHPRTRMGLADAGAHCATICDGAMPTFMLSYWARDRQRGKQLPLEYVVARQTSGTAQHYGLHDRGVIAPGRRADLNVIDFDALGVTRPQMAHDLPSGAPRFVQHGSGYVATVCAGEVVAEHGEFTGQRPGRLIRGPQSTLSSSAT